MVAKYITFPNGKKFLLNTFGAYTTSDPNEYNSYFTASEVYDTINYNLPNAAIGYVRNGEYSGFLGELEDFNGNKYNISFSNGVLSYSITLPNGATESNTYNHDCILKFYSSAPDGDGNFRVGIGHTYPWNGGTHVGYTSYWAYGCFSIEASYLDFVDINRDEDWLTAQVINSDMGVFGISRMLNTPNFVPLGVGVTDMSTTGAGFTFGTGANQINIDNSVIDYDIDPYDPGGNSGTGGGNGNFDPTGDNIEIPGLPTLSAIDTGFITLFNPTISQMRNLASYMWTGAFDINNFKKIFANPMDCILGLSIVPVAVPDGSAKEVKVGNISTGISMTTAGSQYVEVDCGSITVKEYWGAYLDYDPYTKAEIYLPYVGTHPISVDDIMGTTVTVKYHVDILSGACTAYVKCGNSVLYEFIGQCSSSIPITGNDWTNVINGVLSIAGSIGTMVATGGLSAPISAGSAIAGGANIASTAINTMKPSIEKSGAMSGTGGMLSVQTPYLILTRPRQALPAGQNAFSGYPSFITEYLGGLSGYTEIESIHLDNIPATNAEITEIETLLRKGVIL